MVNRSAARHRLGSLIPLEPFSTAEENLDAISVGIEPATLKQYGTLPGCWRMKFYVPMATVFPISVQPWSSKTAVEPLSIARG